MADVRRPDMFARAQLRLAVLFAAIVVALVVVSSVFMYLTVRTDIQSAASGQFQDSESEQAFVSQSLGSLRWQLVAVDAAIVVIIGVGGLLYARRTLKPIRENVAAQKRFVADASHDLRTPLAIMKAEFEVALRRGELDEQARAVLVSGLEEVDRMSGMVEDLLTLSRIDAHQEPLAREPLDLAALARATVGRAGRACGGRAASSCSPRGRRRLRRWATQGTCAGRCATWCATPWSTRRAAPSWRCPCSASPAGRGSWSPTTGRGCRPRCWRTCSTASTGRTRRAPATVAARGSGSPSPTGRCAGWAAS